MVWLLAIFIFPGLGIVLFFANCSTKLSKRRRAQQQSINDLVESATKTVDPQPANLRVVERERYLPLITQNQAYSKMPARRGNAVQVIDDYQTMIDQLIDQINLAKHYVYLEYSIIALDAMTAPLFDALEQATGRGTLAQMLPSGPGYEYGNNLSLFVSLMYAAKHRIMITNPYFCTLNT